MTPAPTVFPAETYSDLALAYLDMAMHYDAIKTLREGLRRYPKDATLLMLATDRRFRDHLEDE